MRPLCQELQHSIFFFRLNNRRFDRTTTVTERCFMNSSVRSRSACVSGVRVCGCMCVYVRACSELDVGWGLGAKVEEFQCEKCGKTKTATKIRKPYFPGLCVCSFRPHAHWTRRERQSKLGGAAPCCNSSSVHIAHTK